MVSEAARREVEDGAVMARKRTPTDAERVARWRGRWDAKQAGKKRRISRAEIIGEKVAVFRDAGQMAIVAPGEFDYYRTHLREMSEAMGMYGASSWPRKVFRVFRGQIGEIARGERREIAPLVLEQLREMADGAVEDPNGQMVFVDSKTRGLMALLLMAIAKKPAQLVARSP